MKENFTVIIPLLGKQCVIWPNECECELRPIQNIENNELMDNMSSSRQSSDEIKLYE